MWPQRSPRAVLAQGAVQGPLAAESMESAKNFADSNGVTRRGGALVGDRLGDLHDCLAGHGWKTGFATCRV